MSFSLAALYYPSIDGAVFLSSIALAGLLPREQQQRWAEPLLPRMLNTRGVSSFLK